MVIDFTVAAMQHRIDKLYREGESQHALMLEGVLELYEMGEMQIMWQNGAPLYRWQCDIDPPPEDLLRDD